VDWLLGLHDHCSLRLLFARNCHSTISAKESVSVKESRTVKGMQTVLPPSWTRNNRVADEVARDDDEPMGKRTKANNLASWIYDDDRPWGKTMARRHRKTPGGEPASDETAGLNVGTLER
jgi:hypothetical protein